ncbi:unnamed protein product [Knipowitschia caucasica]|uniref:Uncharacterized protein n=1 Tax=Knipowitschia caucasica TaxID=637954 RepID=A0AAV2KF20_KNICA
MHLLRTLLLLSLLAPLSGRKTQGRGGRWKGHTVRLRLDPKLPTGLPPLSSSSTANMSLAPWVYKTECVASRVPQCLSHARCLTSGCVLGDSGYEDRSLEAKPIYYQLLVIHRVPRRRYRTSRQRVQRKGYDFRLDTELVSVGCTCVRPIVLSQD